MNLTLPTVPGFVNARIFNRWIANVPKFTVAPLTSGSKPTIGRSVSALISVSVVMLGPALGVGVTVGGTLVAGGGVTVGGTLVAGGGVTVGGIGVTVGGTLVAGGGVAVGGIGVTVGGTLVAGGGVAVGGCTPHV